MICISKVFNVLWWQRIGDSFRGWVETDAELDAVMTYFRQVTHSYWGTRQSPSQSKPSTRLMWKSQYVPFDGIPFINAGELHSLSVLYRSLFKFSHKIHNCCVLFLFDFHVRQTKLALKFTF